MGLCCWFFLIYSAPLIRENYGIPTHFFKLEEAKSLPIWTMLLNSKRANCSEKGEACTPNVCAQANAASEKSSDFSGVHQ